MLPSEGDHLRRQRRQSWWLIAARLVSGRTQGDASAALGFAASSSYGDLERGVRAASLRQLAILATLYEVPLSLFTEPPMTDEERLEEQTGRSSKRTEQAPSPRRRRQTA